MPSRWSVIAICAVVLASAPVANAQRPFTIGLSVGPSLPAADFNDSHKVGINAAAHVGVKMPASSIGFRLEGFYNLFDNVDFTCGFPCPVPEIPGQPIRIAGAGASVIFDFIEGPAGPYVVGGAGAYNVKPERSDGSTDLGFNAGVGGRFRVAALRTFVEARMHTTRGDLKLHYVPVTVGIEF